MIFSYTFTFHLFLSTQPRNAVNTAPCMICVAWAKAAGLHFELAAQAQETYVWGMCGQKCWEFWDKSIQMGQYHMPRSTLGFVKKRICATIIIKQRSLNQQTHWIWLFLWGFTPWGNPHEFLVASQLVTGILSAFSRHRCCPMVFIDVPICLSSVCLGCGLRGA